MNFSACKAQLITFFVLICFFRPDAQGGGANRYPEMGKSFPDFQLNQVANYCSTTASLKDFEGRWLILDFWSMGCAGCIASFAHTDSIQQRFGGNLQIVLVASQGKSYDRSNRKMYALYQKKYHLRLANAYDSNIFDRLGVTIVPHLFWIDNHGTVKAISSSEDLTIRNVQAFLDGRDLNIQETQSAKSKEKGAFYYDYYKPLLIGGSGGGDSSFIYRSVLTKWTRQITPGVPLSFRGILRWKTNYFFQPTAASLNELYKLAYTGTSLYRPRDSIYRIYYTDPVVEIKNPAPFNQDSLYCYSFCFPADKYSPQYIQQTLKSDLQTYFGYRVSVETRVMPYWRLVCTEQAREKLRSKGITDPVNQVAQEKVKILKQPVISILYEAWTHGQHEPPIIDETGINFDVDITLDSILPSFDDFRRSLSENGLILIKGRKEMKVIVIRDATESR